MLLDTIAGSPKTALRASTLGGVFTEGTPLKTLVDEASATTTYVCEAAPGTATSAAAWRIQRIVVSGTITTVSFAGTGAFDQVADNRASLGY